MDTAENQRDSVMYVIAKTMSTANVMRLVLIAGLFLLRNEGIRAIENISDPIANTKSCQ